MYTNGWPIRMHYDKAPRWLATRWCSLSPVHTASAVCQCRQRDAASLLVTARRHHKALWHAAPSDHASTNCHRRSQSPLVVALSKVLSKREEVIQAQDLDLRVHLLRIVHEEARRPDHCARKHKQKAHGKDTAS